MAPLFHLATLIYGASIVCTVVASPAPSPTRPEQRTTHPNSACAKVDPVPSGRSCGVKGSLNKPVPANDPSFATTLRECQTLCARHHNPRGKPIPVDPPEAGCISFSFNSKTSTCFLYATFLRNMQLVEDNTSSNVFYDADCYSCPNPCPQAHGVNLLDNSGFESSPTLIGPWNSGNKATLATPGQDSKQALVCSHKNDCNFFQTALLCPGATYHLSMYYKIVSDKPQTSTFSIVASDMSFLDFVGATNNSWETLDLWFTSDSKILNGAFFDFSPNANPPVSDLYIDRATLVRELPDYKPPPGAQEMVANGNFEDGVLAPWTAHTFGRNSLSISSDPTISGNYSLLFKGAVSDVDGTNYLRQDLNLDPGHTYLLRYDGQKVKGRAEYPSVYIGDVLYDSPYPTTVGDQYFFNLPFLARDATVMLELDFEYGPLLIDNISVKKLT